MVLSKFLTSLFQKLNLEKFSKFRFFSKLFPTFNFYFFELRDLLSTDIGFNVKFKCYSIPYYYRIGNRKLGPWLSSDLHKLSIFRPFKFDLDLYSSYHIMRDVCCLGDLQGNLVS